MKVLVYIHTFVIHSAASTVSDIDISKKRCALNLVSSEASCSNDLSAWTTMMHTPQMMRAGPHFWTQDPSKNFESGRAFLFWGHKRSILRANRGQWVSSVIPVFTTVRRWVQVYRQATAVCTQNNRGSLAISQVNYVYTQAEDICNYVFTDWLFVYLTTLWSEIFHSVKGRVICECYVRKDTGIISHGIFQNYISCHLQRLIKSMKNLKTG